MLDRTPLLARTAACTGVLPLCFDGVSYSAGATSILSGIDLTLSEPRPTVLIGPNGSGKTTLLRLAMGLLSPTEGRITYDGALSPPPGCRAMVFQSPVMLRRTVAENVAFALNTSRKAPNRSDIARLLDLAGLASLAERPARRLSGGEQRRLALVRALARSPAILFLDEPTDGLDPAATHLIEEIIAHIASDGIKVVMSTHDLGQARRLASDVVFLARGRIAERAPASRFFAGPATELARTFLAGGLII